MILKRGSQEAFLMGQKAACFLRQNAADSQADRRLQGLVYSVVAMSWRILRLTSRLTWDNKGVSS